MLAIVIPYYKITFFEGTLESLANQTDQRFKVYIGDDASPQNPLILLEKYNGQFDFEYHRFESNFGGASLVKQWERCIALSGKEEWIMILGDDDVLGIDVVEEFYNQYEEFSEKSNLVRFATIVINEQTTTKSAVFIHPKWENGLEFYIRKLRGGTRSSLSEYFFRREMFLKYHFHNYPSAFYSDDRAWIDFSDDGAIYSINKSIVYIRISDHSISGGNNKIDLQAAGFEFIKYIYGRKLNYFNKFEKLLILNRYENALNRNEVYNVFLWLDLYLHYILSFEKVEFIKFNKRILRKIINWT